jgi:hypothetical protein
MQPLSLEVARDLYLQGQYDRAYAVYEKLHQALPVPPTTGLSEEQLLRDFLQLKMALCLKKTADTLSPGNIEDASDQANHIFRTASQSRSPAVRVVANYHRSLLEMQRKQYIKTLTTAYQTIALLEAVDFDRDWALSLQRDCHFLVAESITRNVLSLCDADKDLPDEFWRHCSVPKSKNSKTRTAYHVGLLPVTVRLLKSCWQDLPQTLTLTFPGPATGNWLWSRRRTLLASER